VAPIVLQHQRLPAATVLRHEPDEMLRIEIVIVVIAVTIVIGVAVVRAVAVYL
jgi:hypothetical protein